MLYVALILIVLGLFLFIYAVVSGSRQESDIPRPMPEVREETPVTSHSEKDTGRKVELARIHREEYDARRYTPSPAPLYEDHSPEPEPARRSHLAAYSDEEGVEETWFGPVEDNEENPSLVLYDEEDIPETPSEELEEKDLWEHEISRHEVSEESVEESAGSVKKDRPISLYEDDSSLVDYAHGEGRIDPTAERYKLIRHVGEGAIAYDEYGVEFLLKGRRYRYDYDSLEQIHRGDNYLAFRLAAGGPVRLCIGPEESIMDAIIERFSNTKGD